MEDLRQLRVHTQRALAAAHQVDTRLESPASARLIVAARVFLGAVDTVVTSQAQLTPASVRTVEEPATVPEIKVGDTVRVMDEDGELGARRYVVKFAFTHHNEVTHEDEQHLYLDSQYGHAKALASRAKRA